jgi:hypothetical protein
VPSISACDEYMKRTTYATSTSAPSPVPRHVPTACTMAGKSVAVVQLKCAQSIVEAAATAMVVALATSW